jgi:hypothetical protein
VSARRRSISYGGSLPAILTFLTSDRKPTTSGTHTYSGVSFGAASSDRCIIVSLTSSLTTATPVTSVTIGGVSATRCAISWYFNNTLPVEIWIAQVPTGTSGNIAITTSAGGGWTSVIGVYAATRLKSIVPVATSIDQDFNGSTWNKVVNTSVFVPAGGFALSAARLGSGTFASSAWTGATKDFDLAEVTASEGALSGASLPVIANTTANISTTFNGGTAIGLIAATASFR